MRCPIRVLQVIDTLGMGGAETWLMEVLRLWSKTGAARMDFVATSGQRGMFDEEAEKLGARIHYLRYGRAHLATFARGFRKLLREGCYDVIHDHQDYVSGWHFLLGGSQLPPVRVTHVHNAAHQIRSHYGVTPMRRITARIGKALVARYASHIAGTSRQVVGEYGFDGAAFQHLPRTALYCGFDPARFRIARESSRPALRDAFEWPANALVALFVGRIDPSPDTDHRKTQKNSGFAIDVGIAAARRDPRVRMLLVGSPSQAVPVLEQRISEAGLSGAIRFAGLRRDVERLMMGANVLLFPSRGEGLGMVAVEAQAAGLPVLASTAVPRECVVIPELVNFREISAGPEAWAEDLLRLAQQKREYGLANHKVAGSVFSIENSAKTLLRLYAHGQTC